MDRQVAILQFNIIQLIYIFLIKNEYNKSKRFFFKELLKLLHINQII